MINLKTCLFTSYLSDYGIIGRYVLNILIGECSENGKYLSVVIKTTHLNRTNAENINSENINLLSSL